MRVVRRGASWRVEVERDDEDDRGGEVVDEAAPPRDFRDLGAAERHADALARALRPCELLVTGPRGELLLRRVFAAEEPAP